MHNWDYPKTEEKNMDQRWRLERLLNYGLNGEKIDKDILIKNFGDLKIPEHTKAFLELLLWNKPF